MTASGMWGTANRGSVALRRSAFAGAWRLVLVAILVVHLGSGEATHDIPPDNRPPVADYTSTPANPTTDDVVTFFDNASDPDGQVTLWTWEFGDGDTSSERNATHRYVSPGAYNVSLKICDNWGVEAWANRTLVVRSPAGPSNAPPVADFTVDHDGATRLETVFFNSSSSDADGEIVNWSWNLGDGNQTFGERVFHRYATTGFFHMNLTVTDDNGARASKEFLLVILGIEPSARFVFAPQRPAAGTAVAFNDSSVDPDGRVESWTWEFGDGSRSLERNPVHVFQSSGEFNVSLYVTDGEGGDDLATVTIHVSPLVSVHTHELELRVSYADGSPWGGARVRVTEGSDTLFDGVTGADGRLAALNVPHRDPAGAGLAVVVEGQSAVALEPHAGVIEIRAAAAASPFPLLPILAVFALVGAAAASAAGFVWNERFRWRWLVFFAPFYTRLARSEVLEHGMREAIYGYVEENPGVHLRGIQRGLKVKYGTLVHHMHMLQKQQYLRTVREGMYLKYYVLGTSPPPAPADPLPQQTAGYIAEHPGTTNQTIAAALGKRPSLIHYHVERLVASGSVRKERDGREVRLFPVRPAA